MLCQVLKDGIAGGKRITEMLRHMAFRNDVPSVTRSTGTIRCIGTLFSYKKER